MSKINKILRKALYLSHCICIKPIIFGSTLLCGFKIWTNLDEYFEGKLVLYKVYKILSKIFWKQVDVYLYLDRLIGKVDKEELRPFVKN